MCEYFLVTLYTTCLLYTRAYSRFLIKYFFNGVVSFLTLYAPYLSLYNIPIIWLIYLLTQMTPVHPNYKETLHNSS